MKILVKFKNGVTDLYEVKKVSFFSKNPCLRCRSDGGCYGHNCFDSEDWGDFIDTGNGSIRMQDVENIRILNL